MSSLDSRQFPAKSSHDGKVGCICESCGKTFLRFPSQIKNGRGKHCSRSCRIVDKIDRVCKVCGAGFQVYPNQITKKPCCFCSRKCTDIDRKIPLEVRFKERLGEITEGGCILWTGYRDEDGYGHITRENGNSVGAHVASWEINNKKKVPKGLCVLHKCDNPSCVNHEHLFIGTKYDNNKDKVAKGRQARLNGEKNGMSKVKEGDVIKIINDIESKKFTQKEIGKKHKVSQSTISDIKIGKTWSHLTRSETGE